MKVLLINGSPRENGNTFQALSEVANTLNEEGIETQIISIGKKAVQGCIACGMCGRLGRCTFKDDLYYKIWSEVKMVSTGLSSVHQSITAAPMVRYAPYSTVCSIHSLPT